MHSDEKQSSLLIWDIDDEMPEKNSDVIFWQSFRHNETKSIFSILYLLEKNADEVKSNYLSFVYDLGESKIHESRVIDYLEIKDDFSYWWMTLFVEKSNYIKSPKINDILKLITLEIFFKNSSYKEIILASQNVDLKRSIKFFSTENSISFKSRIKRKSQSSQLINLKVLYKKFIPHVFQGLIYFVISSYKHWQLKGLGLKNIFNSDAKITFVDYLFNFDLKSANSGEFKSNYWTLLPKTLEDTSKSNWLHIYVKNESFKSMSEIRTTLENLNNNTNMQTHFTLSSFISFKLIFRVLLDWMWLQMRNRNLKKHFKKNTKIYWPLMKDDFDRSFIGVDSFSNLMFLNLFKQAAFRVPKQMKTVYLQENQGWESAFLHYWRKGDHENKILGYPHATVAFWTLMYFNDPRLIYNRGKCHYQIPDSVAVSGNSIKNMYINGQYPENLLTKVESLRFLHLENVSNASFKNNSLKPKLLILGDYEYQNTYKQLKLLIGALAISDIEIDILMKPHPSCPILKEEFPEINMQISNKNISTLLEACSIVYTGNATSASVDAYLSGKKVISVLSPKTPNLSPLRGNSDVVFITSEIELAEALRNMKNLDSGKMNHRDFFFINSDLPLWKKLLST